VVTVVVSKHGGNSVEPPTSVISVVAKDGWTIATGNGPTANGKPA
jgi:hypothetical protein